jgi:hypothetical protein
VDDLANFLRGCAKPEFCQQTGHEGRNLSQTFGRGNERKVGSLAIIGIVGRAISAAWYVLMPPPCR